MTRCEWISWDENGWPSCEHGPAYFNGRGHLACRANRAANRARRIYGPGPDGRRVYLGMRPADETIVELPQRLATVHPLKGYHRPDFNDRGNRKPVVQGESRPKRTDHPEFADWLDKQGLLGEYDDVKPSYASMRDVVGTAALMERQAALERREVGVIHFPRNAEAFGRDRSLRLYLYTKFSVRIVTHDWTSQAAAA